MSPSVTYVLIVLFTTSAMISLIFFIAWKSLVREPYTLSWAIAFLLATAQWGCTLARDRFPSFEAFWLVVNGIGLVAIMLILRGHIERTHVHFRPGRLWLYTAALYALAIWATLVDRHVGIMTAIVPASAAVMAFISAFLVLRFRTPVRPADFAAAVTMLVFGIVQVVASSLAFMQGADGNERLFQAFVEFRYLTLPAAYIALAMFVIFMLASDLSEKMKQIAVQDQLTGLLNRRGFSERAALVYAGARRSGRPVSVIMTDIDRFKDINDRYGHMAGDHALQHFAHVLAERRRAEDIVARMGGEEFALVLPGTTLEVATSIARALCDRIETRSITAAGETLEMTASFGVSTLSERDTCLTDAIVRADRALYRSKRAGRNRIDIESSQSLNLPDGILKRVAAE